MNYGQQENIRVKEQIVDGLFSELAVKSFSEITVASLIEAAGVARASYYRNFNSKEEILRFYLNQLITKRRENHHTPSWTREAVEKELIDLFDFFFKQKDRFLLLFNSGLSAYIFEFFQLLPLEQGRKKKSPFANPYLLPLFTGAIPSILFTWLKKDNPESSEKIAKMVLSLLPEQLFIDEK
ncbi:TetR/AcrR family transcriptional regulator [Fructobacillus sp. M1-13]|uniref:TetR/AcrR family transcriptional regulator n=1 Tax=Fructobacillus papyriferae TaxID=2713171 RepID=A0ABS5QTM3_9LACO|nr:TetR/AcrR family transcriptional regulator [Fructobacillus papyriferae]MBS9335277.1 TetR/AcrR family transcriptional regulator [Fructobacillus papyriferae]MCD2159054.1 TetR/AcrR family transcriptional regulator [Fructobacillus papyriferae]